MTTHPSPEAATPGNFHWRSRSRAAGIHFLGNLCVAALAAAVVFGLWYPWPYRVVSGGVELFALLVSVDVIVGPLATFAVFDTRKVWAVLRRDLVVIVALQIGALGYGLYTTFIARPVALALEGNRFRAVSAISVEMPEMPDAPASLRDLPVDGPRTIRTVPPADGSDRYDAIQLGLAGVDLGMRPKYWRVWDETGQRAALAAAKPLKPLLDRNARHTADLDGALARAGRPVESMVYLPLLARRTDWVVLLDAGSGAIVGFAPLDGF